MNHLDAAQSVSDRGHEGLRLDLRVLAFLVQEEIEIGLFPVLGIDRL